jgi:magnesium chelatase family protein
VPPACSPGALERHKSDFALAIAIGVLIAAGKVPSAAAAGVMFFGELGLDGRLRPVRGVLPAVVAAENAGFGKVMVAEQNAAEAVLVPGVRVIAASTLTRAADWLRGLPGPDGGPAAAEFEGGQELPARERGGPGGRAGRSIGPSLGGACPAGRESAIAPDLAEMLGQSMARRAAEVGGGQTPPVAARAAGSRQDDVGRAGRRSNVPSAAGRPGCPGCRTPRASRAPAATASG